MFGKDNLLSAGFKSAAEAQFAAELAEAREHRNAARGWRRAIMIGLAVGVALAFILPALGVAL